MENQNKILVLAPHTDDGELGCGGAISKFLEEGKVVHYAAFSIAEKSVPEGYPKDILEKEVKNATQKLGINPENLKIMKFPVREFAKYRQDILEEMIKIKKEIQPDLVFIPSSFDIHQDHKVIHEEALRAFKHSCILGYEFIWNNFSFNSSSFVVINEEHLNNKIQALKMYESQSDRFYTTDESLRGLAKYRGLQIGSSYAESFEVIRWIIR